MRIEFRSDRRGYMLMLERDLFGAFILYRRWYGLDNRRGGEKRQVFFDEETVLREVGRIQNARKRHGYAPWPNAGGKVEPDRDEAQVKALYFEHDLRRLRPRRLRAGLWRNARCQDFFVESNDVVRAINNL